MPIYKMDNDVRFGEKVFLGGTCNDSTWRDKLIPMLNIQYFNPVVDDWTPECMEREVRERKICTYCLYTITPKMKGVYSIAEIIDDSNKKPDNTILCVLWEDDGEEFEEFQRRSLRQVMNMARNNGANVFESLDQVASFLNERGEKNVN